MKKETLRKCLEVACCFSKRYGFAVSVEDFKEVMTKTLHKMSNIRRQIEEYSTADEYIPLLFDDMLYEHFMFAYFAECQKGADSVRRAAI